MGSDVFEISVNLLKMIVIFLMMVQLVPLLVWVERRGSAYIQNRFGPNRVGPLGLTQLLADAVKFLMKEEFVPEKSYRFLFYAAPVVALIPAALAFAAIPLSMPISIAPFTLDSLWPFSFIGPAPADWSNIQLGPYEFVFQGYEIGIGIVFVLGVSSLAAYALLLAGYGSNNKYSLFGAIRASAQTISYELAMGLSLVGVLLLFNTFSFAEIVAAQSAPLNFMFLGQETVVPYLPNWGVFYQPVGAILLFTAMFAETNRLPFDLPEAEGELVAGYHTEYGGIKMNMFYIGEYGHMLVASALMTTFYFGGYTLYPWLTPEKVLQWFGGWSPNQAQLLTALVLHGVFLAKILFFLWIFIWVRWTLPRFRYDQLMNLGWKTMLPWALANTIITAVVIFIMRTNWEAF